ncbi:hypothetical protein GKZ89_14855 [Bacillus mangrovi]|uniref:Uncharacterized protein n=1 Tax=Metabacillus mangrovi TaxID=1491830 RepID=A0A7X2S733_9BACI|nr:hypothetical protein [Metabacillus mangrovi]MTH54680.1 hypothetical protein [Metabacillus mangrovi]
MEKGFRMAADMVYRQPEFIRVSIYIMLGALAVVCGYGIGRLAGLLLF